MCIKQISVVIYYFIYYEIYYFSFLFTLQCQLPENEAKWKEVSRRYNSVWNFPHCINATDVKHIQLLQPPQSGNVYLSYKGAFRIVLVVLVDIYYQFVYVNVGVRGTISDGGVFSQT
jgi:hypothetical protein